MENSENKPIIAKYKEEINHQVSSQDTLNALVTTTFKGLKPELVKRALLDGMLQGFTFENFLKKDVYAVPFKDSYSLVTSIGYARKIGAQEGIVGKSAPDIVEKDGKIISCTITVEKKTDDYIGKYTATVFFDEYNTGRNLWLTKPKTMLFKVAEVHAIRMACPESTSKLYIQEEFDKESVIDGEVTEQKDVKDTLFETTMKTIEAQEDKKKKSDIAKKALEFKDLTDEQKAKLQKHVQVEKPAEKKPKAK